MEKKPIYGTDPDKILRLLSIGEDDQHADEASGNPEDSPVKDRISGNKWNDGAPASRDEMIERLHARIEGYHIIEVLGEGGMGIVYLAEQQYPVRRQVALKIIKPGMDSKRVLARFEAEQQALAWLDHPNIAKVFNAGTTETGCPFFVMEYVEGVAITEFCDSNRLSIHDRLGLFSVVCQAIQHAHQKGIIHRDIKPSNILVAEQDGQPRPKIIDFGVAKAVGEPLTECTLKTEDSQLLGTPEYMSPEQADMATEDIDTRSDVYSLGVLLYALLSGVLPFDVHSLRDSGIEKIRRTIRETDPKTPSTRLKSLGQEAKQVAEQRSTEISTLTKHLKKELEWIPLKAMRKERSERYCSALELADDIENYLNGAPLIAGPPTTIYRLRKLARRHKSLVASLIAVFAVLTAGIIVSSVFALEAHRRAQRLVSFVDFLTVDVLGSAKKIKGRDATVIDLIDAATEKLDAGKFKDQPVTTESLLRFRLGNLIKDLGYPNKAVPHLERVRDIYLEHGIKPPETGRARSGASPHVNMNYLGLAYLGSGEREKAEKLFRQMIEEKEETNDIYTDLYPHAKLMLAEIHRMRAQYTESERILLEMMDPQYRNGEGIKPAYMVRCMHGLAETYRGQGRYEEADQIYIKLQEMGKQVNPFLLAWLYLDMERYRQAEEVSRAEIERIPESPGKNPRSLMNTKNNLAVALTKQALYDEAERLFEEVLKVRRERWSDDHPETLKTINAFGVLRREQKKYEQAESFLLQALKGREQKLGADHFTCFETMHELAILYKEQELYDKAEPLLRDAIEGRREKLGITHPHTQESIRILIDLYEARNKPEKAEEWRAKLEQIEDFEE